MRTERDPFPVNLGDAITVIAQGGPEVWQFRPWEGYFVSEGSDMTWNMTITNFGAATFLSGLYLFEKLTQLRDRKLLIIGDRKRV